jgi:hypothetical protein
LAALGQFSKPEYTQYLAEVLERRLEQIAERYLLALSPLADLTIQGDRLCGTDLARRRSVRPEAKFRYSAMLGRGDTARPLRVSASAQGRFCVALGARAAANDPYEVVTIRNGVARYALEAHVYDRGAQGYRLLGIARPETP